MKMQKIEDTEISLWEACAVLWVIALYVVLGWGIHQSFGGCL